MRKIAAFVVMACLFYACPASAYLTNEQLAEVGLRPTIGFQIPADIRLVDEDGRSAKFGDLARLRPTLLILADFNCHVICGPILASTAASIRASGLVPGRDFNIIVVGIDPAATRIDALNMKAAQFGGDARLAAAARFLSGDDTAIAALSAAIGYHARYDPQAKVFAHPSDLLALTPDRRISRLLPGFALSGPDLRFALVEARAGLIGALVDRARVVCYGFDPARGLYDGPARTAIMALSASSLLALLFLVAGAQRRRARLVGQRR